MINLIFMVNRETFRVTVKHKEIYYCDRIWNTQVRLIPRDENFVRRVLCSRNKIPRSLLTMFNLTRKEQKEYDNAKTETDLADICVRDARMKGGTLLKREVVEQ